MVKFLLTIILSASLINVYAQNAINSFSKAVGLLSYTNKLDGNIDFGTGTLIRKDSAINYGHVYLITNKHVLPTFNKSNSINFKIKQNIKDVDTFEIINIPIFDNRGNYYPYIKFDSAGEDVCAIQFDNFYTTHNLHYLDTFLIPYQFLLDKKSIRENRIQMGNQVYFIGYPSYFFNSKNISPIVRSGFVSTDPTEDYYYSKEFLNAIKGKFGETLQKKLNGFLIDGSVYGGSSGSLIFFILKAITENEGALIFRSGQDIPYVLGIICQSFFDLGAPSNSIQRVNLATAISSEVIRSTIDLFR